MKYYGSIDPSKSSLEDVRMILGKRMHVSPLPQVLTVRVRGSNEMWRTRELLWSVLGQSEVDCVPPFTKVELSLTFVDMRDFCNLYQALPYHVRQFSLFRPNIIEATSPKSLGNLKMDAKITHFFYSSTTEVCRYNVT